MSEEDVNKAFKTLMIEKKGVVRVGQINLSYNDFSVLRRQGCLNDEIINAYLEVIVSPTKKCYLFNTFFYDTLVKKGYQGVAKWIGKDSILSYDKVIVPVYLPDDKHWCLMVMDMKRQKIEYMDSDKGNYTGKIHMERMLGYLANEYRRVTEGGEIDLHCWEGNDTQVTQQENDWDCGVLVCQFAKAVVEDIPLSYIQASNTGQYRREMILALIK